LQVAARGRWQRLDGFGRASRATGAVDVGEG
jgi:hypothetical protein